MVEPHIPPAEPVKRKRSVSPRKPKKKSHKTAIMFAVSVVLALANLVLLVKLGVPLK